MGKSDRDGSEKLKSPEQLNDYIKVTNPSVWLLLLAAALLAAGLLVWAFVGRLETTVSAAAICGSDGTVTLYVKEADVADVSVGDTVRISNTEVKVASVAEIPVKADESFGDYALYVGGLHIGEWVYPVTVDLSLEEGVYTAGIVTDRVSPISFLLN